MIRSDVSPHEGFPEHLAAAHSPYADAWKEFDKLQKRVKGRSGNWWAHFVISNAFTWLGGGAFGVALWRSHKQYVIAAILLLAGWAIFKNRSDRQRFAEWPCPRCHAVWPGSKKEKDTACKVCGLRLHQLAP